MNFLFKKNIYLFITLILVSCSNQLSDKQIDNPKGVKKKNITQNENFIPLNKEILDGKWYFPTLSNSYIEIKENTWNVQLNEMNIFSEYKMKWLNSTQIEIEKIKSNEDKAIANIGYRDTITIIELTKDLFKYSYIEKEGIETIYLVRDKDNINPKIMQELNK